MRESIWLLVALPLCASAGMPREDRAPPNEPPQLWRASATEQQGKVVVQIERPEYVVPRKAVAAEAMTWRGLRPLTLGATAHAFGTDGRKVDSEAVLRALARPAGVAVFVRYYRPLLEPDPFYLGLLREGTIVLVVAAEDIADPIP